MKKKGKWIDFSLDSLVVAQQLIGAYFTIKGVGGIIVETEAYDEKEAASHGYSGETARTRTLFGPPGVAYVYRSYGIHWCFNIVCRERGHAAGVLLRALEPTAGLSLMTKRRGVSGSRLLCTGPGRLAQALAVSDRLDGISVTSPPFELEPASKPSNILVGPRVGLSRARNLQWRFGLEGSDFLSRPFHAASQKKKTRT